MAQVILRPNAAGTYQAWTLFGTPTPPSHWEATNDESDTSGVSIQNTTSKETENLADSTELGAINWVRAYMRAKAPGGASAVEQAVILWLTPRDEYESEAKTIDRTNFTDHYEERALNPDTGSPWTWDEVNTLEIGARASTLGIGETVQVSEFWIVVDYSTVLKQVTDSGAGADSVEVAKKVPQEVSDSGEGADQVSVKVKSQALPSSFTGLNTRTVEVIRVGTIALEKDYPGKQVVRLRDLTDLYEGGALAGTKGVEFFLKKYRSGTQYDVPFYEGPNPWEVAANPSLLSQVKTGIKTTFLVGDPGWPPLAVPALKKMVDDLYARLKGKRLAGINVNVWDQIAGAYLGSRNTDRNGTLVLPTDTKFVEVLQWQLAGGGYSDCFNGERAAGMPGLAFYFPCNEGAGLSIASFSGVSGQQALLPSCWEWYAAGFFNRPALKRIAGAAKLDLVGTNPEGRRGFQFLWYCDDPGEDRILFEYGFPLDGSVVYSAFLVRLVSGKLTACAGTTQVAGSTSIQAGKWYLVQVNTQAVLQGSGSTSPYRPIYDFTTTLYLNASYEAQANAALPLATLGPVCSFDCAEGDGLDELRHLDREIYPVEIAEYAWFLKQGRYPGMSDGKLGEPGW